MLFAVQREHITSQAFSSIEAETLLSFILIELERSHVGRFASFLFALTTANFQLAICRLHILL